MNLARLSESLAALANFIDAARMTLLREADLAAEAADTST